MIGLFISLFKQSNIIILSSISKETFPDDKTSSLNDSEKISVSFSIKI